MNWTPYHYVEVLVDFYYRKAQRALRYQYEWQQEHINDSFLCVAWYSNSLEFLRFENNQGLFDYRSRFHTDAQRSFLNSFGIHVNYDELCTKVRSCRVNANYILEVDSILEGADKSKKVNSALGLSPHIV